MGHGVAQVAAAAGYCFQYTNAVTDIMQLSSSRRGVSANCTRQWGAKDSVVSGKNHLERSSEREVRKRRELRGITSIDCN